MCEWVIKNSKINRWQFINLTLRIFGAQQRRRRRRQATRVLQATQQQQQQQKAPLYEQNAWTNLSQQT